MFAHIDVIEIVLSLLQWNAENVPKHRNQQRPYLDYINENISVFFSFLENPKISQWSKFIDFILCYTSA